MSRPPLSPDLDVVLIILPTWVGDTVMATGVLRATREQLPDTRLVGLVRRGLQPLLAGGPWLDEIITVDPGAAAPWRIARQVRARTPSAALLLPNSLRSALTAWMARIKIRVGYRRDARGLLLTHRLTVGRGPQPTPTIDYYARLGEYALGIDRLDRKPELLVTPANAAAADDLLHDVEEPFVVLNPGANREDKRWPAARFAEVAEALHRSHRLVAVVSGAPGERDVVKEVATKAKTPTVDLVERGVTLGPLTAVLARAALLVTNDTGPRHMAAALATPRVTLFGPTDHRWTTLDDPRERLLLAEPFLPEERVADRHRKLCMIDRIPVSDVLASAEALLAAAPASAAAAP